MKKILVCTFIFTAALFISGCATNVAKLADSSDGVGAIKKLSKMLIKDSGDQEAADVFDEVYRREMDNNLTVIGNGVDRILSDFAKSQGKSTAKDALASIVKDLGEKRKTNSYTVMNSTAVQETEKRLSALKGAYYDLMEIQKAVKEMPDEIGGETVYTVEKNSSDFEKGWTDTANAIGDFYVLCANSMLPSIDTADMARIIEILEKKAYPAYQSYDKVQTVKKTIGKLSFENAEAYLSNARKYLESYSKDSTNSDKKSDAALGLLSATGALTNYSKAKEWDSSLNITEKNKEANYLFGVANLNPVLDGIESKPKDALKSAFSAFTDAKGFKDSYELRKLSRSWRAKYGDGERFVISKFVYTTTGTELLYDEEGNLASIKGKPVSELSAKEIKEYDEWDHSEIILIDGCFDQLRGTHSLVLATDLYGKLVETAYEISDDGTITVKNPYGKVTNTFTTEDGGKTYIEKIQGSVTYYTKR